MYGEKKMITTVKTHVTVLSCCEYQNRAVHVNPKIQWRRSPMDNRTYPG